MTEHSESSPVPFILLLVGLAVALGAGAIVWAIFDPADDPFFLIGAVMIATLGAAVVAILLSFLPTARRRRDFVPGWFSIILIVEFAAVIAIIVLLVLALIAAVAWGAAAPYLLKAGFILGMALGELALWSFLALQLHRLIARESAPHDAPEMEATTERTRRFSAS